jgi:tetratricopeptide (TPR) repeat protein
MRFAIIAVLLSLGWSTLALAQRDVDHWGVCANASRLFTPQRQYESCSLMLDMPTLSPPMRGFAFYNRGNASLALGNFVTAVEDYDHAVENNPRDANVFKARCWALSVIGRLDEALADCSASLRLAPEQDDTLESRGLIYLRQGEFSRARADFERALQLNPPLPGSLFGRGIAQIRLGDIDGGRADIMAARILRRDIDQQFERFGLKP